MELNFGVLWPFFGWMCNWRVVQLSTIAAGYELNEYDMLEPGGKMPWEWIGIGVNLKLVLMVSSLVKVLSRTVL